MILANGFIDIIAIAIAVIISIVMHEYAHGLVAKWNGDNTAKMSGRLTLNPLAHFDLIGFMMLMVAGFGYAKPVPVNPYNFKHQKTGIFTVAIAGITTNLILAFICCPLYLLVTLLAQRLPQASAFFFAFQMFFIYMIQINLSLIFFNLLPIYPLDGFRIVEAFTKFTNKFTKFLRDYGMYFLIGLIGLGIIVDLFNMPAYFDILGLYIRFCSNAVQNGFMWLWGLLFNL